MVFKCQENSFLKEYHTIVESCEEATFKWEDGSIKHGFNVILNDTILFPEGGGQPCDYGTMNGKPVWSVKREGSKAVHFVESNSPYLVNEDVKLILDWPRRLDHMQQHSGQHLITALFDREFGIDTTSWWLGSKISYIEISTKNITKEQVDCIEKLANELIFEGRKVSVRIIQKEQDIEENMRSPRGLPKDHVGPIRVITIEGIESNMCCGTHISNLSQLQAIKLLDVEISKKKLLVKFLVGNRVLKELEECYQRQLHLNTVLNKGPSDHMEIVEKIQTKTKQVQKNFQKLLKEVAVIEAEKVKNIQPPPKFYCLHRQDGVEIDFLHTFFRNAPKDIFYFVSVSESLTKGLMMIRGSDEKLVQEIGSKFAELLDGKGNGKGGLYQAKISNLRKIDECNAYLKKYYI